MAEAVRRGGAGVEVVTRTTWPPLLTRTVIIGTDFWMVLGQVIGQHKRPAWDPVTT